MKHIARRARFPTDTNRDHEFTNWGDVARLASDMPSSHSAFGNAWVHLSRQAIANIPATAAENHGWCTRTANGENPVQRCLGLAWWLHEPVMKELGPGHS
jgi:hypothetical protein